MFQFPVWLQVPVYMLTIAVGNVDAYVIRGPSVCSSGTPMMRLLQSTHASYMVSPHKARG